MISSVQTPNKFQDELDHYEDRSKFDVLLRKHFGGKALSKSEADDFKSLGIKLFGEDSGKLVTNFTPTKKRGLDRSSSSPCVPSTISSLSSEGTGESSNSKASSGLARVLHENRAMKKQFVNVRLKDVEEELFDMDKTFHAAAIYHADYLLFMK